MDSRLSIARIDSCVLFTFLLPLICVPVGVLQCCFCFQLLWFEIEISILKLIFYFSSFSRSDCFNSFPYSLPFHFLSQKLGMCQLKWALFNWSFEDQNQNLVNQFLKISSWCWFHIVRTMKEEQRDIQQELLKFISGASKYRSNPLELTKTALFLLKSLPSSRDAVLEFFNKMFDWSLERHIAQVSCNYMHCFLGAVPVL